MLNTHPAQSRVSKPLTLLYKVLLLVDLGMDLISVITLRHLVSSRVKGGGVSVIMYSHLRTVSSTQRLLSPFFLLDLKCLMDTGSRTSVLSVHRIFLESKGEIDYSISESCNLE